MWLFISGLFVGSFVGVVIMALMNAVSRADDTMGVDHYE